MSETGPSEESGKPAPRRWTSRLMAVGMGLLLLSYIMVTLVFKPDARVGHGPAGNSVSTGPANVSDAEPGVLHLIPDLTPKGGGAMAPEVKFLDAADHPVTLSAFRGKVVLVNLWATWCAPCKAEMPALARLQAAYQGKDLVVLPLSIDSPKAAEKARAFIAEHAPLKLYRDPDYALPPAFNPPVVGVPASFFVDRQGHIRGIVNGDAKWEGPRARAAIDQLLAE